MRLLARIYATLDRTAAPGRFDRLYRLDPDPFGVQHDPAMQAMHASIVRYAERRAHGLALDLGCGTGSLTRRIAPYCEQVVGIDCSARAIHLARAYSVSPASITWQVADLRAWHPKDPYDLVIASELLTHLKPRYRADLLAALAQHMYPQSWLILAGRADDASVQHHLTRWFAPLEEQVQRQGPHPFAVTLWQRYRF